MSSEKEKLRRFDNRQLKKHLEIRQKNQTKVKGCKISKADIIADLADRTQIPDETLRNWEKGYHKPKDYSKVLALAEALEISPEDLEKENDEKDKVISMTENNVINNDIAEKNTAATETENTMNQFLLMSSSMNDMFDMMKKYQEISGTSKNAVVSVYHDISDFLETYRSLEYGTGKNTIAEKFNEIYKNFRKLRLEIPKIVYDTLEKFMTEYLWMIIGIDIALPVYLKDADSRMHDIIEFASDTAQYVTNTEHTKMTKELWNEFQILKKYITNKSSCNLEYTDHIDELFCAYELENDSKTDNYVLAAMFMSDLYSCLFDMNFLTSEDFEWYIDNTNLYKATFINDAYRHLDEILSAYIP